MLLLSDIAYYVTDRINSGDVSINEYITTDCILQDKCGRAIASNLPPKSCCLIRYAKGDVLVANIRPYLKKIWFADIEGGCSADVLVFRPKVQHSAEYLYVLLSQDSFFDYVMKGVKGSKMPRGDKDHIMRYKITDIPSIMEENIGKIGMSFYSKIAINRSINHNLRASREQSKQVFNCRGAAVNADFSRNLEPTLDRSSEEVEVHLVA